MNPTAFAMRHPITTLMLVVVLVVGGAAALRAMRVDIFPPLNTPHIYVVCDYAGLDPGQVEGLLTNQFEQMFQYVDGVKSVDSRSIQNLVAIKLTFFPGTDMSQASAQVVAMSDRALHNMPAGTLPPLIIRMDGGSVPIGYLVMDSTEVPLGKMFDLAMTFVRPLVQSEVPGTIAIPPYGANVRAIVVNVDPEQLRAYNLTAEDVVQAVLAGNAVVPAGNLYVRDQMPLVPSNAMVVDPQDLGKIALKPGHNVYLRDVARIEDATDMTYGYALVNGRKSIYIPMVKKDTASTLDVVARIRAALPLFQSVLPENVTIRYEFDESPTVVAAIRSVATEGLIGAFLTGLMILLFLRDWRSVLVVVLNIPLALLGSLVGLWLAGHTLNIMTLGGLALAVGLLVDEATVSVENIHVQMEETPSLARAVERGSLQTAVPRLLAMLCILSVFIPALIMQDPVRALFLPLALAVGFAMVTSYVLSSTVVPVLSVWLLRHRGRGPLTPDPSPPRGEGRTKGVYATAVGWMVRWRRVVVPVYLGVCALVLWQVGSRLGTELFPQIDSGVFVLRFRPPPGSNYEVTREVGLKCLEVIGEEAGKGNVAFSMGYVGQCPPNYAINNLILFMRGPDDGMLRVALRRDSGIELDEFRERLRKALPKQVVPWLTKLLQDAGLPPDQAAARARMVTFGFAPGDMVSEVMSFGSPTPIEVAVISPHLPDARTHAERVLAEMKKVPYLRDVQFQQSLEYPTVRVEIDREKAGLSGVEVRKVGQSVTVATSSSRYVAVNFWQDRKTGVDYQVQVQVPIRRMTSPDQVEDLPVEMLDPERNLLVRDVASVKPGVMPGEYDRLFSQRFVSITANVEGEDLGRAAGQIEKAIRDAGEPPRGVRVQVRGQLPLLRELFQGLGVGLVVAVFVILVLLTAYFESPRLALVAVSAVPGVVSGVAVMLYVTGTTLNLESFMGAIMCIGVSVSNSVMLVAFTAERWQGGLAAPEAAVAGAVSRLRPILMTATAMTIGTIPMALALEEGSAMTAPLGRAVIGGLIVSTFTTLLVLPAFFAVVIGRRPAQSSSVHPDDPASVHYDKVTR